MTLTAPAEASTTTVRPARRVRGSLRVPGDKSISHRAALFNALGDGAATITNFSPGADCGSTLQCLRQLGVPIAREGDQVQIGGAGLHGLQEPEDVLDCGNSGTSMRLLAGMLAGAGLLAVLSGDRSLRARPMARIVQPLQHAGAHITGRDGGRLPPLVIQPTAGLQSVEHQLSVASAQVKSCLLLAGLLADGPTTVIEPAPTRDHTERLLRAMGADVQIDGARRTLVPGQPLRCVDVQVPGDFSSAAFWVVLGCLHPLGSVRIKDVGLNPSRTGLLRILQQMGANVTVEHEHDVAGEPVGDLVAAAGPLRGTVVAGDLVALSIDEVALVALLGLFAEGETVVRDAGELRTKESDRLAVVAEGFRNLGGDIVPTSDGWIIRRSRLEAGRVDSHGDHRMAMLFALAGSLGEGAEIVGADSVAISYPSFWADLEALSA